MIDILLQLHKYVPIKALDVVDEKTQSKVADDLIHGILFGGDQMTRKRAETAKQARKNSTTPTTKLEGLIPVCEDWHSKKIFLEVCPYL